MKKGVSFFSHLVKGNEYSSGQAIRKFIKRFDLVYFGHVDHRYDEHAVVRGVTASAQHTDHHFAVGNIKGRDVSIVERTNKLFFPGKGEQHYTWIIVEVDLKQGLEIPHTFIDAHHHDDVFYANLFVNFSNFHNAKSIFMNHDPAFNKRFKVFTPSDKLDDLGHVMTTEITSMLAHHFTEFDYELRNDTVYVYNSNNAIQERDVERMARVGLWLAEQLER